jgi:hypothetical protein
MTRVLWDQVGEKVYETGVDRGVLYIPDNTGDYVNGYAWNGLTAVTESPSGAESNKQYADNTVYLNLKSAEEFGGTIEAFTYPDEFGQCDGTAAPTPGVRIGQQVRKTFGLSYRTLIGNDLEGTEYGYKIHLIYGADAAPSERAYGTVNDSPEAITFSWEIMTTPVPVGTIGGTEYKPTSYIEIDSTEVDPDALSDLEDLLYGTVGTDPSLPTPAEVVALFEGAATEVLLTGANAPSYNSGTYVITLPTVAGVTWKINGVTKSAGAQPALAASTTAVVTSHLGAGYVYAAGSDNDWSFSRD